MSSRVGAAAGDAMAHADYDAWAVKEDARLLPDELTPPTDDSVYNAATKTAAKCFNHMRINKYQYTNCIEMGSFGTGLGWVLWFVIPARPMLRDAICSTRYIVRVCACALLGVVAA